MWTRIGVGFILNPLLEHRLLPPVCVLWVCYRGSSLSICHTTGISDLAYGKFLLAVVVT